jgi:hypothetical protein
MVPRSLELLEALLKSIMGWLPHSSFPRPKIINPTDKWFFLHTWQVGEKEADDDLHAGRYEDFENIDEVVSVLMQNNLNPSSPPIESNVDRVALALRRFTRRTQRGRR